MAQFPAPSERIVLTYERVLGPEHPHTLATRNNLAYWTRQAGSGSGNGVN